MYQGDPEQYFSFITPESFLELEKWIVYRKECGEDINGESWIMRNICDRNKILLLYNDVALSLNHNDIINECRELDIKLSITQVYDIRCMTLKKAKFLA